MEPRGEPVAQPADELRRDHEIADVRGEQQERASCGAHLRWDRILQQAQNRTDVKIYGRDVYPQQQPRYLFIVYDK